MIPSQRSTIICVEDDPAILHLIQRVLVTFLDVARYELFGTTSISCALSELDTRPVPLVITDYLMPGMNGLQLHIAVKQRSPTTRVLLVTGYTTDEIALEADRQGIDAYITKPFTISHFRTLVITLLDKHAAQE